MLISSGGVCSYDTRACFAYLDSIAKKQSIAIQFKAFCDMDAPVYNLIMKLNHPLIGLDLDVKILGLLPADIEKYKCATNEWTDDDENKANGLVDRIDEISKKHDYLVEHLKFFVSMRKKSCLDMIGGGQAIQVNC